MVNSPHRLEENIFFPLISLCIYPYKGSQRTSGIFTPFSLKCSLLNRPGREGTSIPGGLLSAGGFAHCHCWFRSPNLESSIIPFPTLQARKFRHVEVKELGQAPPAFQWQTWVSNLKCTANVRNCSLSQAGAQPASETGALWRQLLAGRLCKFGLSRASKTHLLLSLHSLHLYALRHPPKFHFPVKISQAGNSRRLLFLATLCPLLSSAHTNVHVPL